MSIRKNIASGSPWENIIGYSRAVRIGNLVEVSGTTASDEHGAVFGKNDFAEQTRYILNKIESALKEAGVSLKDVVRTRIYTTDISKWQEIGKVHGDFFGTIKPAATMVEIKALVNPEMLVEIEATAWIG